MNYLHTENIDFAGIAFDFLLWLVCGAIALGAAAFVLAGLWEWVKIFMEGCREK